jgi:hypothetical protein
MIPTQVIQLWQSVCTGLVGMAAEDGGQLGSVHCVDAKASIVEIATSTSCTWHPGNLLLTDPGAASQHPGIWQQRTSKSACVALPMQLGCLVLLLSRPCRVDDDPQHVGQLQNQGSETQ